MDSLPRELLLHIGAFAPYDVGRLSMLCSSLWRRLSKDQATLLIRWLRRRPDCELANAIEIRMQHAACYAAVQKDRFARLDGMDVEHSDKGRTLVHVFMAHNKEATPCPLCGTPVEPRMMLPGLRGERCHLWCFARGVAFMHMERWGSLIKPNKTEVWSIAVGGRGVLGIRLTTR